MLRNYISLIILSSDREFTINFLSRDVNLDKMRTYYERYSVRSMTCVLAAVREIRKRFYTSLRHCTELACSLERGVYNNYRN